MKNTSDELKDRLIKARKAAGYSGAQVARAVGMSQPSYRDLEQGITQSSGKLIEIADFLRVSPIWLKLGKGAAESPLKISTVEEELLELFRSGNRNQKAEILKQIIENRELKE